MQETKLFEFIKLDDCDKVKEILLEGANPTVPVSFRDGKTAIGFAVSQNKPRILEILIESCLEEFFEETELHLEEDSP